ncbi:MULTISPECIES: AAA family ATPase [Psychrobacter]|uniref:Chromosome partition protein Smc n=1 Tax=Psychrobacter alimentarius TaxID=261164 RepID=A0ABN4N149_9GAMM|nr:MULTISPECIES: AAA family ATPase [Psychrobacter]AMT96029.1 Chromosome partition protein Smc [Psychrobacter alimentarius]QCB31554.1 chromosome segregation protein SMC [Psychrobacter sp. PAMC27889]
MRLKSLKLAGFKSFANPTTFTFRHGITAIVGPNGCGKSNVIDAIRWVLGETSAKQLRGGAMSDVIFAGTQDKAAKSVASVELTFEHTQDEQNGIRHEFNLYQELSVRRQVNLEGRSDYFINGTRCRRRDVVDVFLGTGLGARSYAVIEQGMIGRIVESSPMQLREFIEEAAGVSRYQARREETQKKLERTQENLARLHDMQSELVRQQKTLSKQAANAQRYEEIALTLADIKQQLSIQQLYQAKHNQQQQKIAHERSAADVATLQASYEALKAKQDKLTAHINQEQWLKDDAQSAHYEQQLAHQKAEHQLSDATSQLTAIKQQLTSLDQQREQALSEMDRLNAEQTKQQTTVAALRPQLSQLTENRDTHKRNEQPLQRAWHEAQNQLNRLQDNARALEQQQAINAQSQKRYQQSYDKWQRRQSNWQQLWQQLQQSVSPSDNANAQKPSDTQVLSQALETQVSELNKRLQQIERQQDSVDERLSELQPQAHNIQQRLIAQQRELSEHEKRHALLAGEYDTLHQILHPKPVPSAQQKAVATTDSMTKVANCVASRYAELGITTVREQIELSATGQVYASLLDDVLALWLDSHVLITHKTHHSSVNHDNDDSQQADSLWQALKPHATDLLTYQVAQNQNAATKSKSALETGHSLWLETAKQSEDSARQVDTLSSPLSKTLPEALSDKVWTLSQLIVQPTLALFQHCYLYTASIESDDDQASDALADVLKALPASAILLTADRWIVSRQGTINLSKFAGTQEGSNSQFLTQRLQQRTRLQALEELLNELEVTIEDQTKAIAKNQRDQDALSIHVEEARAQSAELTRDKHQYQQQLTTQQASLERLQADSKRLISDKVALEQEQQELVQEQQTLNHEQQHIEGEIAALTPKIAEARVTSQQLQAERSELARARQADDDAWQALQLRIQQSEMRLEHSASSLVRATEQYDKSLQSEHALKSSYEQQQHKLPALQAALQTTQTARDEQQAILVERETALAALKTEYAQQQTQLETAQDTLQNQQSALAQHATELALSAARLEDISHQTQDALTAFYEVSHQYKAASNLQPQQRMSVSNLLADFIAHDRRVRPDKITELEKERTKLEQQLGKIGAVNLAAVAELAEVNERLEPLEQQTTDIASSMETLTQAIASIDETTKTLFMQTLDAVNQELANLFAKVFGGGQASLTLNTDDMPANIPADKHKAEQWRAGLTLMAQPKGKRNSLLAVLSGGEKTLTALSLIFAIFKQHPAPFCVLDEVDAPLDDANVARFTSLIHELADDLQFIFISHNKLTMQIAHELKGVTMPSAGISTLVSVSLDEAERYISE